MAASRLTVETPRKVPMEQVVMKHRRTTLERAEKFISNLYFTDVNLYGRLYPKQCEASMITHWAAPLNVYTSYEEAVKQKFAPVEVGQSFGPTWGTHWFHVTVNVPLEWIGEEVRLRWNSSSEALVWVNGQPRQGLCSEYERFDFPLTDNLQKEKCSFSVYIEMACNGMFGAGDNGMIAPPKLDKTFTLNFCQVAVFNRKAYNLLREVELLHDIAKHMPEGSERGYQALYTVNDMINNCDVNDTSSYERCHQISAKFFKQRNGDSQHTTYAMGHAHIDTAWLWPYSETIRKCARSWSCTIRLMEKYPNFTFTCSQAQQYEWIKERYPSLYEDIKKFVKEGRFIPVGGTWVEMDGLIPSGEAFIRQFLYGQKFFEKEFGMTCKEFWLPDTFGYSGQLPQIMRHCGITRFLTQKMSWNLVNKFPHHTFYWEGIDNSKVLAHFPSGDTYEMKGNVQEVLRTAKNFQDKGRSDKTAFLFGFGDGGNGPSEDMIERLDRIKDVDGLPRVKMSTPDEFFTAIENEDSSKLCRWAGELYLEMHNGTYTTHAKVKKMNRKCELLLQHVEFLSCVAMATKSSVYPSVELNRLWKLLLLNQFHDVLPGSSIGMVYEDAHKYYNSIMESGSNLLAQASTNIFLKPCDESDKSLVIWNTVSWDRSEVISVQGQDESESPNKRRKTDTNVNVPQQIDKKGNKLYYVKVPSYGMSDLVNSCIRDINPWSVNAENMDDGVIMIKNDQIEACIDKYGRITKLLVNGSNKNMISSDYPANQFILYDDIPLYWDAWDVMDYHLETRKPVMKLLKPAEIEDNGPLRVTVMVSLEISKESQIEQTIILDVASPYIKFDTKVKWFENRKFLKVEFPTSMHTREATYDIQFGHIRRPNHQNTSWDTARYEVCGHKWTDISEYGFGVAVLNDSKYGHSAVDNILRLSLLRSSKAPDRNADMGEHEFTYGLMPHTGTFQEAGVIKQGYCLNSPLNTQYEHYDSNIVAPSSYFTLDSSQVVLDTVKKSEDNDDTIILRLYESFGGSCCCTISTVLSFSSVQICNGLEQTTEDDTFDIKTTGDKITFNIKPFQILTLKIKLN
ncbi:hypothetical protein ACF0H5_007201 [Mactra antiquata]